MNEVPKDILFTIANNLELPDLLRLCESNKKMLNNICNNDSVWRYKLGQDYPDWDKFDWKDFPIFSMPPREIYVFLYQLSFLKKRLKTEESIYDIFLKKEINLMPTNYLDSSERLKKIPALNLPNLETLFLEDNLLTQINFPDLSLPKLNLLTLTANRLTELSKLNFSNLRDLYAAENRISKISELNLPNLVELDLRKNKLKEFPQLNLPNLELLILSENELTELPYLDLPKLDRLDLNDNSLTKISKLNLPKLRTISLSNNNLTEFPQLNAPNLDRVYLGHNSLTEIPKLDFPNLTTLYLQNNKIRTVSQLNLPKLNRLNLENNQLSEKTRNELRKNIGKRLGHLLDLKGQEVHEEKESVLDSFLNFFKSK